MANEILEPVNPVQAFAGDDDRSIGSQITFYMLLGALFGFGRESIQGDAEKTREQFPIPEVKDKFRLDPAEHFSRFTERYGLPDPRISHSVWEGDLEMSSRRREISNELVGAVYRQPSPDTVADLILLGINDPNEFIRAASAISFIDIFKEHSLAFGRLIQIAADHDDEFAGEIAQTALMRLGYSPTLGISRGGGLGLDRETPSSTLLLHGSFFGFVGSKIGDWWKPGGGFHTYLKANHCPNLYGKPDFFTWSGGWSDHARQLAARDLKDWVLKRNFSKLDILAHSHGGNVVMWATQLGLEVRTLILLSCPQHLSRYIPEFSRIDRIISYQIQLDWIILADGGGIRFNHPDIEDRVQNQWFRRHVDTHDPDFWKSYGLTMN